MGLSLSSALSNQSNLANGVGEQDIRPRLPEDTEVGRPDVHTGSQNFDALPNVDSFNEPKITKLLHALQRIARRQREATKARIASRETHREALLKRKNVWVSDANFMKEVQHLVAKGKLAGFEELLRLAIECQNARDSLGPTEQDDIEAEQRWEGQIWKLRHAEQHFYFEFKDEFSTAENCSTASPSVASSPYRSNSDAQSQASNGEILHNPLLRSNEEGGYVELSSSFEPIPSGSAKHADHIDYDRTLHDHALLGIEATRTDESGAEESIPNWDSGFGDIEAPLSEPSPPALLGPHIPVHFNNLESFPRLLTDFSSIKERINRWLGNSTLSSHIEGMSLFNVLQYELDAKNISVPSNWAQLVVAYWELEVENDPRLSNQALATMTKRQQQAEKETGPPTLEVDVHQELSQETSCLATTHTTHEPGALTLEQSPYALSILSRPQSQLRCDCKHRDFRKDRESH